MAYYSRVFCTANIIPVPNAAINWSNTQSGEYVLEMNTETLDEYSNGGKSFVMSYAAGMHPIQVDINPVDDTDPVAKEEIKEFISAIGFVGFSSAKRKVIQHLENTTFIVACEIPEDIDQHGQDALANFAGYFVEHSKGLLHVDGEGFYNSDMTILLPD